MIIYSRLNARVFLLNLFLLFGCSDNSGEKVEGRTHAIMEAFKELLSSRDAGVSGGFVIFEAKTELEYVQYSLDKQGLMLYWPAIEKKNQKEINKCKDVLGDLGFIEVAYSGDSENEAIARLQAKEYLVLDDGLYSIIGRDQSFASKLTSKLLGDVYGFYDVDNVKISVELYE